VRKVTNYKRSIVYKHWISAMRGFESFSIGAGWCQALSDCSVDLIWDVTRRSSLLFGIGTWALP
jgi:hypothetical protein